MIHTVTNMPMKCTNCGSKEDVTEFCFDNDNVFNAVFLNLCQHCIKVLIREAQNALRETLLNKYKCGGVA